MKRFFLMLCLVAYAQSPDFLFSQVSDSLVLDSQVLDLMNQYDVPGLTLSIVVDDSTFLSNWGYADAEQTIPITQDTRFRIASVAKVLVAATVAVEVAAGTVGFQQDISNIIPFTGQYSGPITLHHLLTHTAGFDERLIGYGARTSDEMKPLGKYLAERMPSRGWPAGEQISYSNHGMSLAGYAIEKNSGLSFAELAHQNVFSPLGMRSTEFVTRGKPVPSNSADPLSCKEDMCEQLPHYFSHAYPAGLAFSTASDMSKFISAMLNAQIDGSPLAALVPERFAHNERLPGMSYGFFNQSHNGIRFLTHAGSVPGYWSLIMISPDANLGFFFSANGGSSRFGEQLRDLLLGTLLKETAATLPVPFSSEDASWRAGVYESTRYSHSTIERFPQVFHNSIEVFANGDTLMFFSGGQLRKYIQTADALYENINGNDKIAFDDQQGKVRLFKSSFIYGAGLPEAFEKRSWHQTPKFLNEYASWLIGAPIIVLFFVWPVSIGIDSYLRRKRGYQKPSRNSTATSVWGLSVLSAALFAAFGFGFVARSNRMLETGELFFGMPDSLVAFSWIPPIQAGLALLMGAAFVLAWKNAWWDFTRRILFSLLTMLTILQFVFLIQWNYLPLAF